MCEIEKSLITGGNGMVGKKITFGLKPSSSELDVTDFKSIKNYISIIGENNISCIIHLASINLRESEENPSKSINVNINGTINMLNIAKKLDIPFILLSSGSVFHNNNSDIVFNENFTTNPKCIYGVTKASSEKVASLYKKSIIIRTGWLFGGNQKTHFKFVESTINNLLTNSLIKASNNFYGSPTYVMDLIEKMKELIVNLQFGIHHVVNDGHATGHDIALKIAQIMNNDTSNIFGVNSSDVPNAGPYRGKTEMLNSIKDYNKMRHWEESIKEYINIYISEKCILLKIPSQVMINNNNKKWSIRETCRLCNSEDLYLFYRLNPTPPANHFIKSIEEQEKLPLDVCICEKCKHVQLLEIVDTSFQYSNYIYVSSTSQIMVNHLKNNVKFFTEFLNLSKNDNILEIGANDGVCIKYLLDEGFLNVVGVDPAKNINTRHNLPIICDFFGSHIINLLKEKHNSFKLIFGFHCCAHIENIKDVFKTVHALLDDNGTFIMEVGYFYEVFKKQLFDTIYHEHIDYHTATAINTFALSNGLLLYNVRTNDIQSGSIQFYFCKNNNLKPIDESVYKTIEQEQNIKMFDTDNLILWQNKIVKNTKDIYYIINSLVSYGKKIIGYGASAKSTTFLYQCNLTRNVIDYIIDDNIYKQNHYTPGLHIPVKSINILETDKVDYIVILSWNFSEELINKLRPYTKNGCRIIIPFPEIKIL